MRRFAWTGFAAAALLAAACGSGDTVKEPAPERAEAPAEADPPATPSAEPSPDAGPAPPARPAPDFTLPGADGKEYTLSDFRGKVVVLEWINHGCPFVKKHYDAGSMQRLQESAADRGVVWFSVCSSAPGKQGHLEPEGWRKMNGKVGSKAAAVLLDPDGKVGRIYGAAVTPHMFVVGRDGGIAYDGAIDDKRSADPADAATARNFVRETVDALLAGKAPPVEATRPYG